MSKNRGLTDEEKRVIKKMVENGERNQDIHALINYERHCTINFGRISGVKSNNNIQPATNEEVDFFKRKKRSFDANTGLNLYTDEKVIRAREAMILAVTIFNSAAYRFKTEVFSVLSNIAWTYLMHDYYDRRAISILNKDGTTLALSAMMGRTDCPLSKGIKNNLNSIKLIRDRVEHQLLGRSDHNWLPLFQACCLNFDKTIVEWFGERISMQNELSIALQFGKLSIEQASALQPYDIPPHIEALDALLTEGKSNNELNDLEYQFKVIYTLDSATKGKAHIQFLHPDSQEGNGVQNVLQKFKIADDLYPYKPGDVVREVRKSVGKSFSMNSHTQAWREHNIRPVSKTKSPEKTDKNYCIYHPTHRDYTYSQKWVDFLIEQNTKPLKVSVD